MALLHQAAPGVLADANRRPAATAARSCAAALSRRGLAPPRQLSLEDCIAYINDDELVEVTPQNIRLRKRVVPT